MDNAEVADKPKVDGAEPVKLRLRRKSKVVTLEDDNDSGDPTPLPIPAGDYTIKELMGTERDDYINETITRHKFDPQSGVRVGYNVKDQEARLVSLCLHDSAGKRVEMNRVRLLPASTLSALYQLCEEVSALNKVGVEQAKKA